MPEFIRRSLLPVSAERLFAWHASPGAFERLASPLERVRVLERHGGIGEGDQTLLEMRVGPFPVQWLAEHRGLVPDHAFTDVQIRGPFAHWSHTHRFEPMGPEAAILEDMVRYRLPGRGPGNRLAGPWIARKLARTFAWRHARTQLDLLRLQAAGHGKLRVAISGSTGLVGSALAAFLTAGGHEVVPLVRRRDLAGAFWDPSRLDGEVDRDALEGLDAVIHLAGENIAGGKWTAARKQVILDSRRIGTRVLAEALTRLAKPPKVFISASAIGYYGDGGDTVFDEQTRAAGRGFLSEVSQAWELASDPARRAGMRVVNPRLGVVLSPHGGALARMLPAFRAGVGGPIGSGKQWFSWIGLDDAVGALYHLIGSELSGPVNLVAPQAVPQGDFARALGHELGRPAFLPLHATVVSAIFGEMGHELLLEGQRVVPSALQADGFQFATPWLAEALCWELGGVPGSLATEAAATAP
ncbi:MAG: Cell division inhibitor [Cyanobacteria bacterium RYN_339]|nr:Cell division inhibitor [Cyanobacteria bacterium RYN_339]